MIPTRSMAALLLALVGCGGVEQIPATTSPSDASAPPVACREGKTVATLPAGFAALLPHPSGGFTLVGSLLSGTLDLGTGEALTASGEARVFYRARLDAAGAPLDLQAFGDGWLFDLFDAAADAEGNLYLSGVHPGSGLSYPTETFVGALGPGGGLLWERAWPSDGPLGCPAKLAPAPGGGLVLACNDRVARLSPTGETVWERPVAHPANAGFGFRALAVDATGAVVLGGGLETGPIAIGDVEVTPSTWEDGFAFGLGADGALRWGEAIAGVFVGGAAFDAAGHAVIAGTGAPSELVVFGYDAAGQHVYERTLPHAWATSLARAGGGELIVGGALHGPLDLGGGPVPATPAHAGMLLTLDAAGTFGCPFVQPVEIAPEYDSIATNAAGDVVAAGGAGQPRSIASYRRP